MKLNHSPNVVARCVLSLVALCAVGTRVNAGPAEDVMQAEVSVREGDMLTAVALFRKAADQGHGVAQARLADLLHAAEFDKEAVVLYRKAAEQGEAAGEFGLGRMYADGIGVAKDPVLALEWYGKAAKKNFPEALEALARAHRAGDLGLTRGPDEANALESRARGIRQAALKDAK